MHLLELLLRRRLLLLQLLWRPGLQLSQGRLWLLQLLRRRLGCLLRLRVELHRW
jgi:hypothetical protein